MSQNTVNDLTIFGVILVIAIMTVGIVFLCTRHANAAQHENTVRTQSKIAACNSVPDKQTCLDLLFSPDSNIITLNQAPTTIKP